MAAQTRPKWEQDQITSFMAWSNFRWAESLKARGRPVVPLVSDINEDFKDGTKAAMLLMVLFGRPIPGIKKTGRHHDNIQNWAILINEMKKEGIDFRKGAPDMVSGDLQSTLAMQWAVIRHNGSKLALNELFGKNKPGIGDTTESLTITPPVQAETKQVSIKEQMLRYLNTYLPPDLQVTNFTTSFQDGRVIKYLLSNLANVNVQDSADPKTLLENCFTSAEHALGIPTMFSAEDCALARVAEEPVMTYVISILQGIRNATDEGKKAAQASGAHLAALEGDGKGTATAAHDLPPPPPPVDLPPPPPPIVETVIPQPQAQSASFSVGSAVPGAVAGSAMAQGIPGAAGNQNYFGSIVQGSVMMELPEIFKIVAFGDFNNFVSYVNAHPNEIFTTAEPYGINVLFTSARLTPHVTGKKFMEFILERFPNSHMTPDRKQNFALHEALEYGCLENFDYLWNLPGAPRPPLVSLIHTAVWPNGTECIERVLQIVHQAHGGTIPALDNFLLEGRTPLITALSTPTTSIEMVRALLSRGSNPGFSSVDGQSPALVVAAACDKWDAVGCMVRESLYQPLPLTRLLCALLFIVGVTPQSLAQFIRVTGSPTNEDDPQTGRSALEHAISLARPDLVTVLLQHGAQVNRVSMAQPWRTPIHYALLYYAQDKLKYTDTVRVLQSWGADFNALDANGQPASNYARNLGLPP